MAREQWKFMAAKARHSAGLPVRRLSCVPTCMLTFDFQQLAVWKSVICATPGHFPTYSECSWLWLMPPTHSSNMHPIGDAGRKLLTKVACRYFSAQPGDCSKGKPAPVQLVDINIVCGADRKLFLEIAFRQLLAWPYTKSNGWTRSHLPTNYEFRIWFRSELINPLSVPFSSILSIIHMIVHIHSTLQQNAAACEKRFNSAQFCYAGFFESPTFFCW